MALSTRDRAALARICRALGAWVATSLREKRSGSTPRRIFYDMLDYHYDGRRAVIAACDEARQGLTREPQRALLELVRAIRDFADVDQYGGVDPIDPIASAVAALQGDDEIALVVYGLEQARAAFGRWLRGADPSPAELEALADQERGFDGFLGSDPAGSVRAYERAAAAWSVGLDVG